MHRRFSLMLLAALVAGSACAPPAPATPPRVVVAVAASVHDAVTEVARAFERDHGGKVDSVAGASGAFARQILAGAPFDLFLSADEESPARLHAAGLTTDAGVVYATGRLALFAPHGSPLTVDSQLAGLTALVRAGRVTRFAIANPDVAPYGRAAEAVLRAHGVWDALEPRLVLGDNVAQAAQFATTGNAVGGLLAASLVMSPELRALGTFAIVPDDGHAPIVHRMVLLARAPPVAAEFYAYLQQPAAHAILEAHGFAVPR